MTEVSFAGGAAAPATDPATAGERPIGNLSYRYARTARATSYSVTTARKRLTAVLSHGEHGYIAQAPEVDGLGYGADPLTALADLQDGVQQYLEVLREGAKL